MFLTFSCRSAHKGCTLECMITRRGGFFQSEYNKTRQVHFCFQFDYILSMYKVAVWMKRPPPVKLFDPKEFTVFTITKWFSF